MNKSFLRFGRVTFIIILAIIIILTGCAYGSRDKFKEETSIKSTTIKKVATITAVDQKTNEKEDNSKINNFKGIEVTNNTINIPVLCYHSVQADPSLKNSIVDTLDAFTQNLQVIKDNGYTTLTISELNNYINNNQPIPPKSILITFDDGYEDNYNIIFPLLKKFNMKATIFVIAKDFSVNGYLTSKQIKEMSDYGIDIQCHTYSHTQLATLSYDNQYNEMKKSKEMIEKLTGKPIFAIAYPSGSYNADTERAAKNLNYTLGFTINKGFIRRGDNIFLLNRTCIDYTYNYYNMNKLLKNYRVG